MRATSGEHWLGLDHIRALAAFLVFAWHFIHTDNAMVPLEGAPAFFPLALLDEGHTGVALFMTLSGYLFAKILSGRKIAYGQFLLNRALRLLPLLAVVLVIRGLHSVIHGGDPLLYARSVLQGFVLPTWSNGGWSVTVELHFYLLLPALLLALRRWRFCAIALVTAMLAARLALHLLDFDIQQLAYLTIIGRIDQFMLGMAAFHLRDRARGAHAGCAIAFLAFAALYWGFDQAGGFYAVRDRLDLVWVALPTLEGGFYAFLIAYYDSTFKPRDAGFSWLLGQAGKFSYSIYLLHFFTYYHLARLVDRHVVDLTSIYVAIPVSALAFAAMIPLGYLSFRFVEAPFLELRRPYTRAERPERRESGRLTAVVATAPTPSDARI